MASTPDRHLPASPSIEHLRKQAKRLAKDESLQLAAAQHRLAQSYGHKNWAALLHALHPAASRTELSTAAAQGDIETVRALLQRGDDPNGNGDHSEMPLFLACTSDAPDAQRIEIARLLLDAGASARLYGPGNLTPLHAAAERGPRVLVEALIRGGGISTQPDRTGKTALDHARAGTAPDRDEIVTLLDRPVIKDPAFRDAVHAIQHGDLASLEQLLNAHPGLLRDRAIEPDCYPRDYFRDPKLVWFVANNPKLAPTTPPNVVEIAQAMLTRGVERTDLDYTLELVLTGQSVRESGRQDELVALLIDAGATPTQAMIVFALAENAIAPIQTLLERGVPLTAPIAAAFGRVDELRSLLASSSPNDRQTALGLAVMHKQVDAARLCIEAGADVNAFLPVHKHSTPLHQAAINDDVPMLALLLAHGARTDTRDTLWNGTPLGWALHQKRAAAADFLRSQMPDAT